MYMCDHYSTAHIQCMAPIIYEIISNKHINCNYFSVKGRAEDVNSPMSRDDLKMRIIN